MIPRGLTKIWNGQLWATAEGQFYLPNVNTWVLLISFQLEGHLKPLKLLGSLDMAFELATFRW